MESWKKFSSPVLTDFLRSHDRETLVGPGRQPSPPFAVNRKSIGIVLPVGRPSPFWILGVPYLRNPQRRSIHIPQKQSPTMPQYGVQTSRSSPLPVPSYSGSNISRQKFHPRLQKIAPMTWSCNFLSPCVWGWSIFLFKKIENLIRGNGEIEVLVYHAIWTWTFFAGFDVESVLQTGLTVRAIEYPTALSVLKPMTASRTVTKCMTSHDVITFKRPCQKSVILDKQPLLTSACQ